MSERTSKDRLDNSRKAPDFWWFHGKDLVDFFEEVGEQGAENIRVIATPGLDEDGRPDLHLKIVPESGDMLEHHGGSHNESHPCPPFCNGD